MESTIRKARREDTGNLKRIWNVVFGDSSDEIDLFFRHYFEPGMTVVADIGGAPVAMGYLLPVGSLRSGSYVLPCAMIYAVATLPENRSRGYGASIVNELVSIGHKAGYKAVVLCPSEDSLFEYYSSRTQLRDWFFLGEHVYDKAPIIANPAGLTPITEKEYLVIRENLLSGVPHIEFDLRALSYQLLLCGQNGGGLFKAGPPDEPACVVAERTSDGALKIKEILISSGSVTGIVASAASLYTAEKLTARFPVTQADAESKIRRFGMIALARYVSDDINANKTPPWFGLPFD